MPADSGGHCADRRPTQRRSPHLQLVLEAAGKTFRSNVEPQDLIELNPKQDVVLKPITIDGKEEPLDIDRFFMGMATQMSEREDHLIVQDLRGIVLLKVFHSLKLKKTIGEWSE